jgi:hypothetical protein
MIQTGNRAHFADVSTLKSKIKARAAKYKYIKHESDLWLHKEQKHGH